MGLPVLWWWQWVVYWWMGLCCGFVVLAVAVAVGVALGLGLGWGGRMGLGWGVCGVLGLGYGVADLGFGFGLWGCRCCGGGSGWFVGGWVCVAGLGSVKVGCCRGFGFREGGGGVDLVAMRVVAGVVVVVVADVAVSCWVGFGRGWVVPEGMGTGIETPFLCLDHGRNPPP
jgi:hypothetical protein|uniref:Uncharacterized protein n=1 Tax=Fagus sylvatica TaxID=28930 RepID=A0A2N9H5B7_FAGSY